MSDNMERDNESLAKEKDEEKEMKEELKALGMYESWYNITDMKQVLQIISESKNMANKAEGNETSTHSNDNTLDIATADPNTEEELNTHDLTNTPPSRYYNMSPVLDHISNHSDSSQDTFETRNTRQRQASSDTDDLFEKYREEGSLSLETKIAKSENSQKLERWGESSRTESPPVDETDLPLEQPYRRVAQDREPFRSCKDAQTPEKLEKLLLAINLHLKQMAELWHSWQRRTTNSKFQWGSPIQVGTSSVQSISYRTYR